VRTQTHWYALWATLAAAALTAPAPVWADHGGPEGSEGPYVPPEPEPICEQHGKFWKVAKPFQHEVWLVDQSNSPGLAYGGRIFIYDDEALRKNAATAVPEVVDLAAATNSLCLTQTGVSPVRPHMLVFNNADSHAVLSFVASGHVVIFDAATRAPLTCFRTEPGVGGVRQAHAIWPAPDDSYVLVANQNGKKFERIATDYASNTFVQEPAATLDLANCTTPNGLPCQDPLLRPDNAPICPFVPDSGYPAYVSLRGGGMFAIDPFTTPMSIVSEYDGEHIPRDGCGFTQAKGYVFGNGGGGNPANPDGWFLWRLPEAGPDVYDPSNPPNTPEPLVLSHDTRGPRDAHGVGVSKQEKYVYFFDRAANVVEIYKAATGEYVKTESLVSPFSSDPTPDLVGEAPDGKYVYTSLRGPIPLSGDPHASTGSTPGLLVIELLEDGRDMVVRGLAPIDNTDADGLQRADGHGIRVRRVN
jgi:DNA-binding beta-propeller fold protein YncE